MQDRTRGAAARFQGRISSGLLLLAALAFAAASCSALSRGGGQGDALQQELSRFHLGLLMQDTPALLRQVPPEARPEWSEALSCFFGRFRVVDYRVQEIQRGSEGEDARVVVWVMKHPVDGLATRQSIWHQQWVYRGGGWFLDTESETTRRFLVGCLPGESRGEAPSVP